MASIRRGTSGCFWQSGAALCAALLPLAGDRETSVRRVARGLSASRSLAPSSSAVQQWHHVAAKILGAGDKVIKDTHDAFEPLDGGHLIELPRHGGMAADHLANIQRKRVLYLGHVRRRAPRHIEMRLAGQGRDGFEISPFAVVCPFLVGDGVRLSSDDEIERIGTNVTPRLGSEIQ